MTNHDWYIYSEPQKQNKKGNGLTRIFIKQEERQIDKTIFKN